MTLVSILGDYHSSILPVAYTFRKKIDKHIIVYDQSSSEVAKFKRLVEGQKAYLRHCKEEDRYDLHTMQIDEDSYESIAGCADRIMRHEKDPAKIYLNTTDGLSSIAIILSSKLLSSGGKVISYDRYDNTYNLHTKYAMHKYMMEENLDIAAHMLLKGYTITGQTSVEELASRKEVILKLTENLPSYKKFANAFQHKKKASDIYGYDEYKKLLESIGKLENRYFIQGTVFEEYIYHLLRDNFDFDDVQVSTTVLFEEGRENEFDILMIKDNHLHTIECKFKRDLDGEPVVYKLATLMSYLDDDGKAMILNIGGGNENYDRYKYGDVKFTKGDKARARYGDIKICTEKDFDEKRFLKRVGNWFL